MNPTLGVRRIFMCFRTSGSLAILTVFGLSLASASSVGDQGFTDAQRQLWSLKKVERPAVPEVKAKSWVRTPVDAFILSKMEARSLQPSPVADRVTLIRRASLDLIG